MRSSGAAAELAAECNAYLAAPVHYQDGKLLDDQGEAVMMQWEAPLMAAHANLICQNGGHVLNVGFGMGLIDEAIQTCVHVNAAHAQCFCCNLVACKADTHNSGAHSFTVLLCTGTKA